MRTISVSDKYKSLLQIGLVLTLMIGYGIYRNFESLRWPFVNLEAYHQTSGTIVSAKIVPQGTYGGLRFHIVYQYNVGNQEFISDRVHFGYQAKEDRSYAEKYIEKYPVGEQVVVFYNEKHPENSVLEPQIKWNGLLEFYLILLILPIAIFGLAAYFYVKSHL